MTAQDAENEEVFELSPFQIDASSDVGYTAQETLAGTRLRTNVRDVGAAMTIMTPEFLEDIGAVSFEEALEFAPNTDTFETGIVNLPSGASTRNQNTVYVRGFANTSLSRDFFPSSYRADTYNTERLTFSRGPNSILFGIAQPGGITNSQSKRARFGNVGEVSNRLDDNGSVRFSFDYNTPVVEDVLAFRIAGLDYRNKYWREPEHEEGTRLHLATKFKPFGKSEGEWSDFEINLTYEDGETDSQRASLNEPIWDGYTPWVNAGKPIVETIGATTSGNNPDGGIESVINRRQLYDISQTLGGTPVPTMSWRRMARGARPGTDLGRQTSLLDESLMPYDVNWLGGSRRYTDDFETFQVFMNKSFFKDLHIELAYNFQDYNRVSIEEIRGRNLYVDVNRFLPNGDDNPNVGLPYIDTNIVRNQPFGQTRITSLRYSASYQIRFNESEGWAKHLGRLRLAASIEEQAELLDRQWIQLSNVTPLLTNSTQGLTGANAFPGAIRNAQNRVNFRHYVDPANGQFIIPAASEKYGEALYAGDAIPSTADAGGVTAAFIADFPGFNNRTENSSELFAAQWFFLNDRVIATYGEREDTQDSWNSNGIIGAASDPVTGLRPFPRGFDPRDDPSSLISRTGKPATKGIVAYPHETIGLFYNESDNFIPVGQQFDIRGDVFPNQTGDGKDYGFKFFLFDNSLVGSITWFETSAVNQASGHIRAGAGGIATPQFPATTARIWDVVNGITGDDKYLATPYTYDLGPFFNALQDIDSEGVEFQMTWNPNPQWRVLFNYSEQEGVFGEVGPRMYEYFTEFVPSEILPEWRDEPTESEFVYRSGTVTNLGELVDAAIADIERVRTLSGSADTRQPLSSANLVATYSFAPDSRLKGWSIGGNARWRDDRFIGFPRGADGFSVDSSNPYKGGSETMIDGLIRYRTKIFNDVSWSLQLNIRNLLDKDDLLPARTVQNGDPTIARYTFQTPRTFLLTNTFKF